MKERLIVIEADSLEEARRRLHTPELIVLEESILHEGKLENIEAVADTVEEAFGRAESRVPATAKIEARNIRLAPKRIMLLVQADDEESAGKGKAELIVSVSLSKKGRKGFWEFGKTSNVYEVVVVQPSVVEIMFREKTKIRAKVRDYFAEDLLESIRMVRQTNAQWIEILELLNPKSDSEIHACLVKLYELNPVSALDAIEQACRTNERANWQIVIKDAHTQVSMARARELREQEIRFRDLDVRVADGFGFFTSIDWHAKSQREPTGLPRQDYGRHRQLDERLRKSIPRYSTDNEAFGALERRMKATSLYVLYRQALLEKGQDETTATLEQKCVAALKARGLE
jgi:hypothetical protein